MSLVQSLRILLKPNDVPTLITDENLAPTAFNDAARKLLPGLIKALPLPDQFPDSHWREATMQLSLMRPCEILLEGSINGWFTLFMTPVFQLGVLTGVICSVSEPVDDARQINASAAVTLHDLSTPLGTIRNCADLLRPRVTGKDSRLIDIITQNLLEVRRTVTAVATTMDAHSSVAASEAINLGRLAQRVCAVMQSDPGEVKVICNAAEDVIVQGSQAQLQRVIINLLSNCICYAASEVTVTVDRNRDFCWLRVEDDGEGIPQKDIAHILTPWFTTGRRGSGLGLSVADRLSALNGGRLDVASENGAVFTVSFPVIMHPLRFANRLEDTYITKSSKEMILFELHKAEAKRKERLKGTRSWPSM